MCSRSSSTTLRPASPAGARGRDRDPSRRRPCRARHSAGTRPAALRSRAPACADFLALVVDVPEPAELCVQVEHGRWQRPAQLLEAQEFGVDRVADEQRVRIDREWGLTHLQQLVAPEAHAAAAAGLMGREAVDIRPLAVAGAELEIADPRIAEGGLDSLPAAAGPAPRYPSGPRSQTRSCGRRPDRRVEIHPCGGGC